MKPFEGTGKIIFEHVSDDIYFEINCSPLHFELKTSKVILGQAYAINQGKFEGTTNDGKKIRCETISLIHYDKYRLTFALLSPLVLGEVTNPIRFQAKLFGLSSDEINFQFKNLSINIEKSEQYQQIVKLNTHYGYQEENGILSIQTNDDEPLKTEDITKLTENICLLVSLVLGRNVSFNSCEFIDSEEQNMFFYQKRLVSSSKGNRYVYGKQISDCLTIMLEKLLELEKEELKCYQTIIGYLNSSSNQYLEDSILRIAQSWEIFADTFLKASVENNERITQLRSLLKTEIRSWHKSNEIKDYDLSFIMNRVLGSLDWEKVIKKIQLAAIQEHLNIDKIGIDFNDLIQIRNQIAHSGRFANVGNEYKYLDLYEKATLSMHVILLYKLGYNQTITDIVGGIPISNNINVFLTN